MTLQEGTKAVGGIVDALKTQPLTLALVIMNIALLALIFYIAKTAHETRQREVDQIYKNQAAMMEMMVKCESKTN